MTVAIVHEAKLSYVAHVNDMTRPFLQYYTDVEMFSFVEKRRQAQAIYNDEEAADTEIIRSHAHHLRLPLMEMADLVVERSPDLGQLSGHIAGFKDTFFYDLEQNNPSNDVDAMEIVSRHLSLLGAFLNNAFG